MENTPHSKYGIDEIYFHPGFKEDLLAKLRLRAALNLDGEDAIVRKYAVQDMVLIFYHRVPSQSLIYRFLQEKRGEEYIRSNTLLNEEELFLAIKSKKFVLVTPKR